MRAAAARIECRGGGAAADPKCHALWQQGQGMTVPSGLRPTAMVGVPSLF
jgi:hypothetical protein